MEPLWLSRLLESDSDFVADFQPEKSLCRVVQEGDLEVPGGRGDDFQVGISAVDARTFKIVAANLCDRVCAYLDFKVAVLSQGLKFVV